MITFGVRWVAEDGVKFVTSKDYHEITGHYVRLRIKRARGAQMYIMFKGDVIDVAPWLSLKTKRSTA